jgi:hypothetical protein
MIHRSFGPTVVCVAALATAIGWSKHAGACLTTTCAVKNPPANCVRDPQTQCWLAGVPLRWWEPCVSFSVDQRGIPTLGLGYAETEALVVSSFALWPSTTCIEGFPSISVLSMGPLECGRIEYNPEGPNSNAVIFQSRDWPHDATALGVTTVSFDPVSGRIVDADMEINLLSGGIDPFGVRYVIAHEAGHYFGIDHSAVEEALMYEKTSNFDFGSPPALTADDITAICLAYPTYRNVGKCDFEPEKGFSPVCGGDIEGSCAVSRPAPSRQIPPHLALFVVALGTWTLRRFLKSLFRRSK